MALKIGKTIPSPSDLTPTSPCLFDDICYLLCFLDGPDSEPFTG